MKYLKKSTILSGISPMVEDNLNCKVKEAPPVHWITLKNNDLKGSSVTTLTCSFLNRFGHMRPLELSTTQCAFNLYLLDVISTILVVWDVYWFYKHECRVKTGNPGPYHVQLEITTLRISLMSTCLFLVGDLNFGGLRSSASFWELGRRSTGGIHG